MGTILLFNVNKNKKKKIDLIAWKFNHEIKTLEKKDLTKTIGSLVGIPVANANRVVAAKDTSLKDKEMMIFSGFDSDMLDEFLDAYKLAGLESIQMKAVVTESNIFWTLDKLYEELIEHIN